MRPILFVLSCFYSFSLLGEMQLTLKDKVVQDYKSFYTGKNAIIYLSTLTGAGLLANTEADTRIASTYQKHLRSSFTDSFSDVVRPLGDRKTVLAFAGSFFVLQAFHRFVGKSFPSRFVERVARMLLVGVPPLLVTQSVLGGTRPLIAQSHSSWRLFQNNYAVSASGHSFFGALPFLALASLTDSWVLKALLISASTFTAFSRLNDNKHYLSQVILGWSLAFSSYGAISESSSQTSFQLMAGQGKIALGFIHRFE